MKIGATRSLKLLLTATIFLSGPVMAFTGNYNTSETFQRCSTKPHAITSACDLKAYANSLPTSQAYALFQGYVLGVLATPLANPLCKIIATDAQAIAAFKQVLASVDCKTVTLSWVVTQAEILMPTSCSTNF